MPFKDQHPRPDNSHLSLVGTHFLVLWCEWISQDCACFLGGFLSLTQVVSCMHISVQIQTKPQRSLWILWIPAHSSRQLSFTLLCNSYCPDVPKFSKMPSQKKPWTPGKPISMLRPYKQEARTGIRQTLPECLLSGIPDPGCLFLANNCVIDVFEVQR